MKAVFKLKLKTTLIAFKYNRCHFSGVCLRETGLLHIRFSVEFNEEG